MALPTINWVKLSITDNFLKQRKIPYVLGTIAMCDIERDSRYNVSRVTIARLDEAIESYALRMEDGDKFPAIIVVKKSRGNKCNLADGNQRMWAAEHIFTAEQIAKGHAKVLAYIIKDTDLGKHPEVILGEINLTNGARPSKSQCVIKAIHAVQECGISVADAARRNGIAESTLARHLKARELRKEFEDQSVHTDGMSNEALLPIALVKDDSRRLKVATIACQHKMTAADTEEMTKCANHAETISKLKSELESIAERVVRRNKRKGKGPGGPKLMEQLEKRISALGNFLLEGGQTRKRVNSFADLKIRSGKDKKRILENIDMLLRLLIAFREKSAHE